MKLEIKYIFPTSTSGANFYIYELPEGLEMRKILAHGTRMQRNPQARGDIFWIFMELLGPKSNLHTGTEISAMASLNLKLSTECSGCWKIIMSNF